MGHNVQALEERMDHCEQRSPYYISSTSYPPYLNSTPGWKDIPLALELRVGLNECNSQSSGQADNYTYHLLLLATCQLYHHLHPPC